MDISEFDAGLYSFNRFFLCIQNDGVDFFLSLGEFSAYGYGPGNVTCIMKGRFGAGIVDGHVAGLHFVAVIVIMKRLTMD